MQFMTLPNAILAGTGRAGSTSLFRYLSEHPEVCGSSTKETQFFLRHKGGISTSALEEYSKFFSACDNSHKIRIEATPHYLQLADDIAPLIHDTLPDVKLIFILREPVSRLFTVYRNLRELDSKTFGTWTFDHFVKEAVESFALADCYSDDPRHRAAHYMRTGCYSIFLSTYLRIFDRSQICILFFDTLVSTPKVFVAQAAIFLNIDESFYDSDEFSQENKTRGFRSRLMYKLAFQLNQKLEPVLNRHPKLRRHLRNAYNLINESRSYHEVPSTEGKTKLYDFYRSYNSELHALLERYGYIDNLPDWISK